MRSLVVVAILVLASNVRAETPVMAPPAPSLEPAFAGMKSYFKGEITGGFVLIGMGTVEMITGTLMLVATADGQNDGIRGAAYPMLALGLAHVVAGIFVNVSSAKRIRSFSDDITRDSEGWVKREEKRMKGVSRQFFTLKIVETVFAVGGVTTAILVRDDHPQIAGAGISLAAGMAATFLFDVVAARRAHRYRRTLAGIAF